MRMVSSMTIISPTAKGVRGEITSHEQSCKARASAGACGQQEVMYS